MSHYLSITQGKIAFQSTIVSAPVVLFDNEDDAADCIAVAMMETQQTEFTHSSSCYYPDEDGRPDFDLDRFFGLISLKLTQAGVEVEA